MLIATLPPVHMESLMGEMIAHPLISGVRYNIGGYSAYSPKETLEKIIALTEECGKKFWLDIKGRQLRIAHWTIGSIGKITLNHRIEVDLPARVYFRGDDWSEIKVVKGNTIFVDPLPKNAVGEGQAINVHGENFKIDGYLTDDDKEYLDAAGKLGVNRFMLSFFEESGDISEVGETVESHDPEEEPEFVYKIESLKGMELIRSWEMLLANESLMAARDDWFINTNPKPKILKDLQDLVKIDPNAILASHIFGGLERAGMVTMADFSDLYLMRQFGYKNFMLSDGISKRHFPASMKTWQEFIEFFPEEEM